MTGETPGIKTRSWLMTAGSHQTVRGQGVSGSGCRRAGGKSFWRGFQATAGGDAGAALCHPHRGDIRQLGGAVYCIPRDEISSESGCAGGARISGVPGRREEDIAQHPTTGT